MDLDIISDSELELEILSTEYVVRLERLKKKRKHSNLKALMSLQTAVDLTPRKKTRNHGFYQRHVYTTDLAGYLNLATRKQLDELSQKGITDEQIEYMLNRKYIKLRRFCEKHEVTGHRYRKHNFSTYLEDFKKYQSSVASRPKRSIYETIDDDIIDNNREKKELLILQRLDLESVVTTDEESEEEEQEESVNEQEDQQSDNKEQNSNPVHVENMDISSNCGLTTRSLSQLSQNLGNHNEGDTGNIDQSEHDEMHMVNSPFNDVNVSNSEDEIKEANHSRTLNELLIPPTIDIDDSIAGTSNHISMVRNPGNDAQEIFDSEVETVTVNNENIETAIENDIPSSPIIHRRRRTRRHKFTQDHVYVTDTAIYLGLCSSYLLNNMFEQGRTYHEIVDFLNDEYMKKKKEREKKEIGLGPFGKANFYSYINENPVSANSIEATTTRKDANTMDTLATINQESSDDEYEERSLAAQSQRNISSDESDENNDEDDDSSILDSDRANFVFRNKIINKEKALKGVLPKSFLKVNQSAKPRATSKLKKTSAENRPGLAKKKKSSYKAIVDERWNNFLADDDESIYDDGPPPLNLFQSDEKAETELALRALESDPEDGENSLSDSGSLVEENAEEDDGDDDGIEIRQYDDIINKMRNGFSTDIAEEDSRSGVDYMLAPRERKSGLRHSRNKMGPAVFTGVSKRPSIASSYRRKNSTIHSSSRSRIHKQPVVRTRNVRFPSMRTLTDEIPRYDYLDLSDDENYSNSIQKSILKHKTLSDRSLNNVSANTHGTKGNCSVDSRKVVSKEMNSSLTSKAPLRSSNYNSSIGRNRVLGTAQLEREISIDEWQQRRAPITKSRSEVNGTISSNSSSHNYDETVNRLEKEASRHAIIDYDLSLSKFRKIELPEKSFFQSALFNLCFDVDNTYEYDVPLTISIDLGNHHVIFHQGNMDETPQMVETLMLLLLKSVENGADQITQDDLKSIKNMYIKLLQLVWMLEDNNSMLSSFSKIFRKYTIKVMEALTLGLRNDKLAIFIIPYHQLIGHLLSQLLNNRNHDSIWESITLRMERIMVLHSCSLSRSVFMTCIASKDNSLYYFDSYKIFLTLSKNPWRLVAGLSKSYSFKFENILNWLYFLHSQQPVFCDWEYFIQEIDSLKNSKDSIKWKRTFNSLHGVNRDLKWDFEEQLVLRLYHVLGTQRFENIGESKSHTPILSYLPTAEFSSRDGCLDMYFRYLVIFFNGYMDDVKKSSFLEKIIPISDIKTYSIGLLKNRINMMLVVSMLFHNDLDFYLVDVLKALGAFGNSEGYKAISDSLFAILKVYVRDLKKLPIASLKTTKFVINAVNESRINEYTVAFNFKNMLDTLENYSNLDLSPHKLMSVIELAGMFLTIKRVDFSSKLSKVVYRALALIQHMFPKIKKNLTEYNQSNKLRKKVTQLIPDLKNIISSENSNNEVLKKTCVAVWVRASLVLGVSVESLVYSDWLFFETPAFRSRYELEFYSLVIEEYVPTQSLSSISDKLVVLLLSTLPLLDIPSFFRFFIQLGEVKEVAEYIKFRNGTDPTKFSALEFSQKKSQITIKILAKVIMDSKYNESLKENDINLLTIFVKKLNEEYNAQKERQLRYLLYREYAISVVRYLRAVAYDLVGHIPEFVSLAVELGIRHVDAPLHERIDLIVSETDFVVLVQKSYIDAFINKVLPEFRSEMIEVINQAPNFTKETDSFYKTSSIYPICLLISLHLELIANDKKVENYVHVQFWMSLLRSVVLEKVYMNSSDIYCLIKVIKIFSFLDGSYAVYFQYHQELTRCYILDLLIKLNSHLIGFADWYDYKSMLSSLLRYPCAYTGHEVPQNENYLFAAQPKTKKTMFDLFDMSRTVMNFKYDDNNEIISEMSSFEKEKLSSIETLREVRLKYLKSLTNENEGDVDGQ